MYLMGATGVEEPFWSPDPPLATATWIALFGACMAVLVFNTSIAIGISLTTPLFISIGTELTIPATMTVDVLTGEEKLWTDWLGAALLMLSFVVLVTASDATGGQPAAEVGEGDGGSVTAYNQLAGDSVPSIRGSRLPYGSDSQARVEQESCLNRPASSP